MVQEREKKTRRGISHNKTFWASKLFVSITIIEIFSDNKQSCTKNIKSLRFSFSIKQKHYLKARTVTHNKNSNPFYLALGKSFSQKLPINQISQQSNFNVNNKIF